MITQLQRAHYITKTLIAFVFSAVLVQPLPLSSQISSGGMPPGFGSQINDHRLVTLTVPAPETDELLKEDELAGKWGVAERIGILLPAEIKLADHGTWTTLADGSRQWRIRIGSEDAKQLALYFKDFYLPRGYQLFIYNDSRSKLIGAFTHLNNHESGLFATEPLPGESVIVELIAMLRLQSKQVLPSQRFCMSTAARIVA
jgi:lysyl endopeptidase